MSFIRRGDAMEVDSNDILEWSISDLAQTIQKKQVSPLEIIKLLLEEINQKDKLFNAYINVMEEEAINRAMECESSLQNGGYIGPLHGIPIVVKDNISVKGVECTAGSEIYKDFKAEYDATLIRKLKSAGAIIIGKSNMSEFAIGGTGDRSYFGATRNPHDVTKITGGSSSGSAASVAANLAYGGIGSDTGGSIRIPSSCCGIVGMKPTFGSISRSGIMALSPSLDDFGPMTKTVKDNALLLNALVDYDPKDKFSIQRTKEDFTENLDSTVKNMTVGIPSDFYFDLLQPEVRESMEESINMLINNGIRVKSVQIEMANELLMAYRTIQEAEAFHTLETTISTNRHMMGEETVCSLAIGEQISRDDYNYALQIRNKAKMKWYDLFKRVDVILTPTIPVLPINIDSRDLMIEGKQTSIEIFNRLTGSMNATGFPAMTVPGISKQDLPVGIQLIGAPLEEKLLYQLAAYIEAELT